MKYKHTKRHKDILIQKAQAEKRGEEVGEVAAKMLPKVYLKCWLRCSFHGGHSEDMVRAVERHTNRQEIDKRLLEQILDLFFIAVWVYSEHKPSAF